MEAPNSLTSDLPWSSISTQSLIDELSRRDDVPKSPIRPQCGSGKKGDYDTGLHVFALILILVVSTSACAFPLFSRQLTAGGKLQRYIIFICQHFGTGVLMATAFVHLLPTAFTSLTDPCLPHAFNEGYRPLAGLVAMASALAVVMVESYLTTRGASHSHSHTIWEDDGGENGGNHHDGDGEGFAGRREFDDRRDSLELSDLVASEGLIAAASPLPDARARAPASQRGTYNLLPPPRNGNQEGDDDDNSEYSDLIMPAPQGSSKIGPALQPAAHIPTPDEQGRLLLQCLLLEAGILFHSVFIGMALSVANGPTFAVFLIAIAFHQCFEGLALGTRISAIHFPKTSPRPWLMVLAFGATTPIGQAIGLFVHRFYDPMSQTGLLMVGFMNAISSGLLLFAGLVQLLAEDFLSERSYKALHGQRRVYAFIAVVLGAALMSAVGAFA
ncbi:Zinc/iron permease [Bombardia bombarda]|uniref:Zinc/iron permease n=1 Tax=Bombardia bombarda TaxID=252184 RepID=A0AA40C4L6_9PEZI|nr:Zinc/iron permease [Bombardia bombarda]